MYIIDNWLNRITMYRLMLYYLIILIIIAVSLSIFGLIPYQPQNIALSALFLYFFSSLINKIFSRIFHAPANIESSYITALILALIIAPTKSINDFIFLGTASLLAIGSKYLLAVNRKHIFNPAAIAVVITAIFFNKTASWWVGNIYLLPFVIIGGLLVVRKIQRGAMAVSFLVTAILITTKLNLSALKESLFNTPLFFFAFVMLTEPSTTPPTRRLQIVYGGLIGLLSNYFPFEQVLVTGNIFSYLVSLKEKLLLTLKEKVKIAKDTYEFQFPLKMNFNFLPGQYMEWTLAHDKPDNRGNRRYFTIASSPTEDVLRIGVKFYEPSSSFKKQLRSRHDRDEIVAGQLAGDFTLPSDQSKKLVFMAGGIGITPFRSMLKYLSDKNEKRDIVVLYSNKNEKEIAYKNILDEAKKKLGVKIVYLLTEKTGRINEKIIRNFVSDYKDRYFYLSGPHAMVTAFETLLKNMKINSSQIKTDFFPGYV